MSRAVLLASQSVGRAAMLRDAGLNFEVFTANIDEQTLKQGLLAEGQAARGIADALAEAKAIKISARRPGQLVIGCDQILVLDDGTILSKPTSPADAAAQLGRMSGQRHRLLSAVVVAESGQPIWRHLDEAKIWIRPLSSDFIADYVAQQWDRIRWTVGCYEVEAAGSQLFARVEGDRWTIIGLPLLALLDWLRTRGEIAG